MAGKLVKHKLHAEWEIGEVESNPLTHEGKVAVTFHKAKVAVTFPKTKGTETKTIKRRAFCVPENLITVGFYD